jgi:hypothetical protein
VLALRRQSFRQLQVRNRACLDEQVSNSRQGGH